MRERLESGLKLVCLVLAALLFLQVAKALRPGAVPAESMLVRGDAESVIEPADSGAQTAVPGPSAPSGPGPRPGPPAKLPPAVEAKVGFIVQNELFGPVPRPPPMALIGIAGADVMLRSPMGQTGLIREGEELGGVKLLKVGTNRVLVLHEGEKKELMLFSGYGSESLLSKDKEEMK